MTNKVESALVNASFPSNSSSIGSQRVLTPQIHNPNVWESHSSSKGVKTNMGYITEEYMVKNVWHLVEIVAHLLYKVWHNKVSDTVWHKGVAQLFLHNT